MKILIVDDEKSARRILALMLRNLPGVEILEAQSADEARRTLLGEAVDLALVDIRLGDASNRDGLALLREIHQLGERERSIRAVVVSAFTDGEEIVEAMRYADDYIFKHRLCEELVLPIIRRMGEHRHLEREVACLRARIAGEAAPPGLVGASPAMERLRYAIRRVALSSERPVLVNGPTGAGKELVVRAIHFQGPHPDHPLLDLNCGAIPEALMETQLFGYERGAFTSADRRQEGYLSAVRQGTLFLDEIAELPLAVQAKLLRVLETNRFRRVGSTAEEHFQGRVVAATHADLGARVAEKRFREDLYYRLNVLQVAVPSLDERRDDIPALVAHFCRHLERPLRFTAEAMEHLLSMPWPGNVRQLRNLIDRLAVFSDEEMVTREGLIEQSCAGALPSSGGQVGSLERIALEVLGLPSDCGNKLEAVEEALVGAAMKLARGNKTEAARMLGCSRKAVERRVFKIARDDSSE